MTFPYFIDKEAPVTRPGPDGDICTLTGALDEQGTWTGGGDHRAHHHPVPLLQGDQPGGRPQPEGQVRVQVRYGKFFWIEDLIRLVEESASCEVYALLKHQDEKFVTEKAYSNPMLSRMWCGKSPTTWARMTTSAGTRWNRKTSSPSTTIPPTPTSNPRTSNHSFPF